MMRPPATTVAERVAQAAIAFQPQITGHKPKSVSVAICGETLVITLRGALSPAEQAMARSPEAAKVWEFHRQLFLASSETIRQEIQQITGLFVLEGAVDVFLASGMMVQVFLLSAKMPSESCESESNPTLETDKAESL